MQNSNAPLFRLLPRDITVVCGSRSISLNYAQRSPRGRSSAQTELPYEMGADPLRERLSHFRFHVARMRFRASRS